MKPSLLKPLLLLLFSLPYFLFLRYMYVTGLAPIDYLTFIDTGQSLLNGTFAYQVNVYYPLPTVLVFAVLAWLPGWLSLAVWFVFSCNAGSLDAGVGSAGFAVCATPVAFFRRPGISFWPDRPVGGRAAWHSWKGGSLLALSLLKPQLALIPLAYAGASWLNAWRGSRRLPAPLVAFAATALGLAAPAFIVYPGWLLDWLSNLRPLFPRALAGLLPRLLVDRLSPLQPEFWLVLTLAALLVLALLYLLNKKQMPLPLVVLWSFIASPLVHDYDLIQLVPLLHHRIMRAAALLVSIPGWYVLAVRYADDRAWLVFALIAPAMAAAWLFADRQESLS